MKTAKLTKGDITEMALKELAYRNCEVWRENNLAVRGRKFTGRKGKPDIIGYNRSTGLAVYCEVKTVNDFFSEAQEIFLACAKESGCLCLIATEEQGQFILKPY